MAEEGYSKISEQFQAIYAFNFAEDGTGTFIRFGVQKPFTWAADGDGKITVTLEGTAGTFTGSINTSTGRLRLKGSDETDAELKQVSKTAGDYSSVAYEPFDQLLLRFRGLLKRVTFLRLSISIQMFSIQNFGLAT